MRTIRVSVKYGWDTQDNALIKTRIFNTELDTEALVDKQGELAEWVESLDSDGSTCDLSGGIAADGIEEFDFDLVDDVSEAQAINLLNKFESII